MPIRYTVNGKELEKDLVKSIALKNSSAAIKRSLRLSNGELLYKKIERLKREMIKDFLNLPVTREISAGPNGRNISGTLGGYGNLFSFIGFEKGHDPIQPIINLLNQTTYNISRASTRGEIKVGITLPSKGQIFQVTPMPWAPGISWAQRIEVGMSGLGEYLNTSSSSSRSGTGIQSGKKARSGRFTNTKYISHFITKWQKIFSKIDKNISIV
jgi:hypothetical protein